MTGILLVDKEQDWTSSDVVAKLRGVLGEKRIGHAGTLDPMATGLLVVMIGRATKASDYLMKHDKRYIAHIRLGVETDTQDITGHVLRETPCLASMADLQKTAESFTGNILQIPPMYSAIKVKGRKLYEIARRGETVERKARAVTVSSLTVAGKQNEDYILNVCCSAGTYVRTLCHDMGQALGCGGCMTQLRRLSSGSFSVENAHTVREICETDKTTVEKWIIPVEQAFADREAISADAGEEKKLCCGMSIPREEPDGNYRVYSSGGRFLMLAKAEKSFFEVETHE